MTEDQRPDMGLGKAVELRRIELGLKRRELAERAHLSYPYISEIENGVKEPSAKALRQIAEALDMKVAELAALIERIEERAPDAHSLLLDRPDSSTRPPPEAIERTTVRRAADSHDVDFMTSDWTSSPPERAMPVSAMALAMPSEAPPSDDERIRDAVSREINTWLRDVLPVIVRAEVERQLDARLDGDAVDGGDHE